MKLAVDETVLSKTTKCRNNFSCLNGAKDCLCDVEDCSSNKVHFIKPGGNINACNYKIAFGYSYTCTCPVRKEIYSLYNF